MLINSPAQEYKLPADKEEQDVRNCSNVSMVPELLTIQFADSG